MSSVTEGEKPLTYVEKGWEYFKNSAYYDDLSEINILPIISDPNHKDGDGDNINDSLDAQALESNEYFGLLVNYINEGKIKFSDVISDKKASICTVPITDLGFVVGFEHFGCYDEYGDIYDVDIFNKDKIIEGYFDNWYIVVYNNDSNLSYGVAYTTDCQKFIDNNSDPFKLFSKAFDSYEMSYETIKNGYIENGFWETNWDIFTGKVSSYCESFASDLDMLSLIGSKINDIFAPNKGYNNIYFYNSDCWGQDSNTAVYAYKKFEENFKWFDVDSDTYKAAKTIAYTDQMMIDAGIMITGAFIATGGETVAWAGVALAPETGGASLAIAIPAEAIAAVAGAEVTAAGTILLASDTNGYNQASQAMRDAEMFENNTKLTEPSHSYDNSAKPKGTKTKINDKMDEDTRTSLEMENEAAETIAKNGYDIEQNPIINNSSRNPDYKIEGKIFDCYSPDTNTSVRNIWGTIEDKVVNKMQTRRIVLNLNRWAGNISDLTTQFENYAIEDLLEILIVYDGDVFRFYPIK